MEKVFESYIKTTPEKLWTIGSRYGLAQRLREMQIRDVARTGTLLTTPASLLYNSP